MAQKWRLFDHLVVMIVQENWQGIGDTDRVIGCVAREQRHVAERICEAHNADIDMLTQIAVGGDTA